ncbi:hypothetical protein EYY60_14335 [Flavobacterium zhairuonense]|uniref:hypothetical protein n=1 Tax=Flavobacterium zhairuonense TaxID=2493631 RepID=UPI0010456BE4|nr:hypothetical protein [Flavobacterium zhairuonense]KAF2509550.1 hypothetical protein EYY60_14335 [Flavobacterium zhairuonense]
MNLTELPIDLKKQIENETIDFALKAQRKHPLKKKLGELLIGILMLAFMSLFVNAFFGPLFQNEEVHFEANGSPVTASLDDLGELIFPGGIIILLVLAGIYVTIRSIYGIFQNGGYFVGTETRLIQFQNGKTISTDWEQFTGSIKIKAKNNFGEIEFELRTGKMESRKNQPDKFVPDIIYLTGIDNVYDIEKKCRLRIKENDPTPAVVLS